tara:strand:+ start:2277 stop:2711 length:435 start_codon:yes stop_codon:yes gene_type:complete
MRHRISGRKFSRTKSQRRALLSGLACSLIEKEQLRTTLPKAKDLRPYVEKLVTLGKDGGLSSRRRLISILRNETLASKLIDSFADRYKERQGGYTRIIKAGYRHGDNAPMAIIEFLERDPSAKISPQDKLSEKSVETDESSAEA